MQLKIMSRQEGIKVVLVDRKVDTYLSLKELVLKEYFGDSAKDPLYRLRAFNVQFEIMLDTYQGREDLTLEQLKIYPMKTLALEKRETEDQPWEAYDPNLMEIRLT